MYQEQKETYIILLIIALGVLFIFISFCYLIYRQFQKNRKLFIEKLNAEYIGRGEERRRIAKDLHDEFGALLSSTKMYLSTLKEYKLDQQKLEKTIHSVNEGLNALHKITNDIYPGALNKNNLNGAINDLFHEYCTDSNINVNSNINQFDIDILFDQKSKAQIYWILKEIIINTVKHSHSETFQVRFYHKKNLLYIKTKDEGVGITINLDTNKRNGITNITNRIEILGGTIELLLNKNIGVEYLIKIPTSNEK
jgi:hypothetical protein